jgi:hypothetical protein
MAHYIGEICVSSAEATSSSPQNQTRSRGGNSCDPMAHDTEQMLSTGNPRYNISAVAEQDIVPLPLR